MKQLIKISVAALGMLCGSVSGMNICISNLGIDIVPRMRPVTVTNNAASQIPVVDVDTPFSEAVKCDARRDVPLVHQYEIERVQEALREKGGYEMLPILRVSMRIDPKSFRAKDRGIGAINNLLGISGGEKSEFWITVIPRESTQLGSDRIQFRPQWAFLRDSWNGERVNCSSQSYVRTFFKNGMSGVVPFVGGSGKNELCLHEKNGGLGVSPSCFDLPGQVHDGGSFAVVYHTVCQNINRDIYGIILVYDGDDMKKFDEGIKLGRSLGVSVRELFYGSPVITDHDPLKKIFWER